MIVTPRHSAFRIPVPSSFVLQLQLRNQCPTSLVVVIPGERLMPASPLRPGQNLRRRLAQGEDEAPEEPAEFGHA
jgi:hypothetical protein